MSGNLPVWVPLLEPAAELARTVAGTDFVRPAMRNKPAAVAACVLTGNEMGLGPMESLRQIHVFDGIVALSAELLRRKLLEAGHSIWPQEMTTTKVTFAGHRRGEPERVTTVTWTMDDARKAGLAGKQVWSKYPRQMLAARASAELCRLIAPDAISGMLAIEEMDGDPTGIDTATQAPEPAKTARTAKRAPIDAAPAPKALSAPQAPAAEDTGPPLPPLPGEDDAPTLPIETTADELAPKKWRDGWFARAKEIGADDDDTRHAIVYVATEGRTRSITEVRKSDTAAVKVVTEAFGNGELMLSWNPDGPTLIEKSDEPFPEDDE